MTRKLKKIVDVKQSKDFVMSELRVLINKYSSCHFKKKIKNLFKTAYEKFAKFIKCFIKKLQNKDSFMQQFKLRNVKFVDSRRERAND